MVHPRRRALSFFGDFWRWPVVHMRVDMTFEIFTTVIVAIACDRLGISAPASWARCSTSQ